MSDQPASIKCPACGTEFTQLYTVPTNSMEPFTCVDVMKGVEAYGIYDTPKTILCEAGEYVHFAFMKVAEEQPADCPPGQVWMVVGNERLVKMEKFNPEALHKARQHHLNHRQKCNDGNCQKDGIPCYMNTSDDVPDGWYCEDHAHNAGFCPGCGLFRAGIESFDFSETGYCASCEAQMVLDEDDYDDDDFDDDFDDFDGDDY